MIFFHTEHNACPWSLCQAPQTLLNSLGRPVLILLCNPTVSFPPKMKKGNMYSEGMKKKSHHKLWNDNFRWLAHQILTFWWGSFRICLPWVAVWCVLSGGTWRQANWVVRGRTQVSSASLSIATTVHSSDKPEDYHTLQYTTRCRTVLYLHYPTLIYSLI